MDNVQKHNNWSTLIYIAVLKNGIYGVMLNLLRFLLPVIIYNDQ
jgi:hypothetical protein